jgi:uridine nucleosidase
MAQALFAEAPHTPWLVATGTLTNVALLFAKFPSLAEHIAGLSIMGGAIGGGFTSAPMGKVGESERFGNWTPWGEFNVVVDPEAAAQIFSNPVLNTKITLAPLDLTHQVLCTPEVVQLLKYGRHGKPPSKLRTMLVELVTYFAATYSSVFGLPSPPLHDPLAVAAILTSLPASHPSAIPFYDRPPSAPSTAHERFAVTVVTDGTAEEAMAGLTQTGRTIATLLPGGEPGVRIPRGLDVGRFWEVLEECLERAEGVSPLGS